MIITKISAPASGTTVWSGTATGGGNNFEWFYTPRRRFAVRKQEPLMPQSWMYVDPPDGLKAAVLEAVRAVRQFPAGRDMDVADILTMCAAGGIPVNTRVGVAIEAHRKAFGEDKTIASMAVRAVILARTPDVQDYRDQLEYLTALPLTAWEDRSDTSENIRAATLAMIEHELQQFVNLPGGGEDQAVAKPCG
jgi:hypothetical protein